MSTLDSIPDINDLPEVEHDGIIRRCGTLARPDLVRGSVFPVMAKSNPNWLISKADAISWASNPNKTPLRKVFADPSWMKFSNQLSVGSCNGWATADTGTILRYKRNPSAPIKIFSGSYEYSWMNGNPSRDNGSALCDGEQVAFKRGMVTVDVCGPNTWTRAQCQQFDSQTSLATDSTTVFELGSEEEIWSAAALGAVIVVAVQVPNGTGFSSYNSGICPAFHGSGNHAIEVIDIEMYNGTLVYVVKNHWGLSWGLDGFGLMTFDSFAETINNHQFWAAFATQETGS